MTELMSRLKGMISDLQPLSKKREYSYIKVYRGPASSLQTEEIKNMYFFYRLKSY